MGHRRAMRRTAQRRTNWSNIFLIWVPPFRSAARPFVCRLVYCTVRVSVRPTCNLHLLINLKDTFVLFRLSEPLASCIDVWGPHGYTKKIKWPCYRPGVAQRVGRGIALLFHYRGTRRGWVVSSTPRPHFTLGKDQVPTLQEAGWVQGPVWTGGKSRPHRDSIPDRPAHSSVAIPTELPGPPMGI